MKTNLASRNLERRIMTASHVLCFNCVWIALNLQWMIETIRSISLDEMGRVRDCSLSRLITWLVNSLQAWLGWRQRVQAWMWTRGPKTRILTHFNGVVDTLKSLNNTPVHICPVPHGKSLEFGRVSLCSPRVLSSHHQAFLRLLRPPLLQRLHPSLDQQPPLLTAYYPVALSEHLEGLLVGHLGYSGL